MSAVTASLLSDLNTRSREVFRRVVESYLETGEPVGSGWKRLDASQRSNTRGSASPGS